MARPLFKCLSVDVWASLGLIGLRHDPVRQTITLVFRYREEIWTAAPAEYPIDGSLEVLFFDGLPYIPPPAGLPS